MHDCLCMFMRVFLKIGGVWIVGQCVFKLEDGVEIGTRIGIRVSGACIFEKIVSG